MLLYNLVVHAYGMVIRLAALNSKKAGQWVKGRANWRSRLAKDLDALNSTQRIWMHCASYGEFEQGRPLMEAIKKQHPNYKIILSFFSPSGYEAFKDKSGADLVCYLPLDTRRNARDFITLVNPKAAIFIKYEFWVNLLFELKARAIPTFLVSAVFKPHHPFFKWYGGFFRRSLQTFNKLFIQDDESGRLLQSIGIANYEVCGDTRFDRVLEIKEQFVPQPFFETFCKGRQVWMAGSSWPGDEELLIEVYKKLNRPNLKLVLVPHNIDEKFIDNLQQLLVKNGLTYQLYSQQQPDPSKQVLVVNAMGLLSKLYHYADVAYIGGGFNSGIHNCLEPAVYLKPVQFYGPGFEKYNEAVDLVKIGAAQNVMSAAELEAGFIKYMDDAAGRAALQQRLQHYFDKNSGVTKKVLQSMHLG